MSTHTATPWITCDDEDSCAGLILIGPPVFDDLVTNPVVKTYNYEDAEFIVRACNAHDDLVRALSTLVERIEYYASMGELAQKNIEDWAYTEASSDMANARAALAKAQA